MFHRRFWVTCSVISILAGCISKKSEKPVVSPISDESRLSWLSSSRQIRSLASLENQVLALDPAKKTVCTVTFNSSNEKNVFKSTLSEKDFNFIELVPEGITGDAWFDNACQTGVQCDVVLVSGHFGGRFFSTNGRTNATLDLDDLEAAACETACSGILSHPKEVFLFGCNTLAGKDPDSRTPEQYTRVLIEDGFTRSQAQQIAAFRYSPVGSKNEDRMRRAFIGVTKLYGFDSKAPLGPEMEPILKGYLNSVGDYSAHLERLDKRRANTPLRASMGRLKNRKFVESTGAEFNKNSSMCFLRDPKLSMLSKLNWIERTLQNDEERLLNIVAIEHFLRSTHESDYEFSDQESQKLESIQHLGRAKLAVEQAIEGLGSLTYTRITLANAMRHLGWWSQQEYGPAVARIIGSKLTPAISIEDRDLICSLNAQVNLTMRDLPPDAKSWTPSLLTAVGCLQPQDSKIHWTLYNLMRASREPMKAMTYGTVLRSLQTTDLSLQWELWNRFLEDPQGNDAWMSNILSSARITDSRLQRAIINEFKSNRSPTIAANALRFLNGSKQLSLQMAKEVIEAGAVTWDPKKEQAKDTLVALAKANPEILELLIELIPDDVVGPFAATILGEIRQKTEHQQRLLMALLYNNPRGDVQARAANMLAFTRNQTAAVSLGIIELLKTSRDPIRRRNAIKSFSGLYSPTSQVQVGLAEVVAEEDDKAISGELVSWLKTSRILSDEKAQTVLVLALGRRENGGNHEQLASILRSVQLREGAKAGLRRYMTDAPDSKSAVLAKSILQEQ